MISAVLVANYNYDLCQEQNEQISLPAFLEGERERKSLDFCPRMSNFLIAGQVSFSSCNPSTSRTIIVCCISL